MSKSLILTLAAWNTIHTHIKEDYPPSVIMLREKMKKVLGFTPREHEEWVEYADAAARKQRGKSTKACIQTVHLDFYSESKRTFFLLKYGDYIKIGKTDS
jgi:hypothetical protein